LLKIVKLCFLRDKRITLPFEIEMLRILSICLLFCVVCLAACKKSEVFGPAQYEAQAKLDDDTISMYLTKYGLTSQFKHVQKNDTIGVFYRIIDSGATNTLYTNSTQITVGDTGRLLKVAERNGPVFFETDQYHPTYPLGSLIMASRYAYGHYAQPQIGAAYGLSNGIPGNAILDFYIRLYDVTN
jgi:FKBP-type peptidyl-prolyl cis-trans isomerase FkpA